VGSKEAGVAVGEATAAAMLVGSADDGRGGPFTFVFGTDPGEWRPAPPQGGIVSLDPTPWVGNVRPFIVPDVERLRLDPPNDVTSAANAEEFNEVKELGSLTSATRTEEQTEAAIFWQDHGVALWNRIMRSLAASRPETADIADSARMFAMADLAAADAAIGCWNNKYYWNYWRPITAIREADTDGNPATQADPTWTPLFDPSVPVVGAKLVTPGFPDYPSGHTCGSGAIVHALQDFFGTDRVTFTMTSNKCAPVPCRPKTFERFSDALKEVIDARVWGGIHFRTADVRGAVLGKRVAHYLRKHYFRAVG
jgi:PAP2 superfamily